MKILGFNFVKISGERPAKLGKTEKITTNVEFLDLEKENVSFFKMSDALKISFKYKVTYEPKQAELLCEGFILIGLDEDGVKEALKNWKKKQIADEMKVPLLNVVMHKCNIKLLALEDELALPLHIKFPKVSIGQKN